MARRHEPIFEVTPAGEGLFVPELSLALDPPLPAPRAFVSHVHALRSWPKAAALGEEVFATEETLALAAALGHDVGRATALRWSSPIQLAGGSVEATVTAVPAGHAFGAAMLVVETARGRLVYAGDTSPHAGLGYAGCAAPRCDDLIVPCAYGLPIFRFPDRAATIASIDAFCRHACSDGRAPALIAPSLGAGLEVASALALSGVRVEADDATFDAAVAHERVGVPVGVAAGAITKRRPRGEAPGAGAHLPSVVVADVTSHKAVRKQRGALVGVVSGHAILDAYVEQRRADAAFVISDRADFDELVAFVRATEASFVTAVYGFARPFAEALSAMGLGAAAVDGSPIDARAPAEKP